MLKVIALDLEGTLISNAMSQIPRPGLFRFLEGCREISERVVIYTTVNETRFRSIAEYLVTEGFAPTWFHTVEYVTWEGNTKDLNFIPNSEVHNSVLVDDYQLYVHPGQEDRWQEVEQFAYPYPESDRQLDDTLKRLMSKFI